MSKRQKVTHTLPPTPNGNRVTVTIEDSRYESTSLINVSIVRPNGDDGGRGQMSIRAEASDDATEAKGTEGGGDGTLRCLDLPPDQAAGLLENINPHPNDEHIRFRESDHKYWIDDDASDIVSSTGFIHGFFEEFDGERAIRFILRGRKWANDPTYKYYMKDREEILQMWETNRVQASEAGTKMHAAIEYRLNGLPVASEQTSAPEWSMYLDYEAAHRHLEPWRTEQMVYSKALRLTGSIVGWTVVSWSLPLVVHNLDWICKQDMQYRAPDGTIVMA